jgi:hypothetical protein
MNVTTNTNNTGLVVRLEILGNIAGAATTVSQLESATSAAIIADLADGSSAIRAAFVTAGWATEGTKASITFVNVFVEYWSATYDITSFG